MAFLTLEIEDAVLERLTDIAAERGEDKMRVAVQVLNEAFKPTGEGKIVQGKLDMESRPGLASAGKTFEEEMLEILAPYWTEEERRLAANGIPTPAGTPGDKYEAYLREHWAEDLQKERHC